MPGTRGTHSNKGPADEPQVCTFFFSRWSGRWYDRYANQSQSWSNKQKWWKIAWILRTLVPANEIQNITSKINQLSKSTYEQCSKVLGRNSLTRYLVTTLQQLFKWFFSKIAKIYWYFFKSKQIYQLMSC